VKRVGDYEIVRKLGEGGMGSVFLARNKDGVPVVLKTPHQATTELVARMEDEARTGFRLRHSHIVRTLDFFQHEGRPVLVIEWIDGASLKELRDHHGRLPPATVARIGEQVSDALATIHHLKDDVTGQELRMLHRDVTPGNIVVSREGDAKLIDLGIARSVESQSQKTAAGILRGTFRYLSPDLFAGAPYSWMTDLWALGVTLFEAALGRRAVDGDNARVFNAVAKGRLTELRPGEELHPMLKMLFDGLLAHDPTKRRFKDPEEVLHAFRVVRARLGDGENETRAVMASAADRSVAAAKNAALPAPSPVSAAPTSPVTGRAAAAPVPQRPARPPPPPHLDIDDAEPTLVNRSGPGDAAAPRAPAPPPQPRAAAAATPLTESTLADVDGNTAEATRIAPLALDPSPPMVAPTSNDAPPTLSTTMPRPARAPGATPARAPSDRLPTIKTTTNVLAQKEPEPPMLLPAGRRGRDDDDGPGRAPGAGLLADPPTRRLSGARGATSPTIPVFVDPAHPATREDQPRAGVTLVPPAAGGDVAGRGTRGGGGGGGDDDGSNGGGGDAS
jgi:serine/threonine protein kinase